MKWLQKLFRPGAGSWVCVANAFLYQVWAKHQSGLNWNLRGRWPTAISHIFFSMLYTREPGQKKPDSPTPFSILVVMCSCLGASLLQTVVSLPLLNEHCTDVLTCRSPQKKGCYFKLDSHLPKSVVSCIQWLTYSTQIRLWQRWGRKKLSFTLQSSFGWSNN